MRSFELLFSATHSNFCIFSRRMYITQKTNVIVSLQTFRTSSHLTLLRSAVYCCTSNYVKKHSFLVINTRSKYVRSVDDVHNQQEESFVSVGYVYCFFRDVIFK